MAALSKFALQIEQCCDHVVKHSPGAALCSLCLVCTTFGAEIEMWQQACVREHSRADELAGKLHRLDQRWLAVESRCSERMRETHELCDGALAEKDDLYELAVDRIDELETQVDELTAALASVQGVLFANCSTQIDGMCKDAGCETESSLLSQGVAVACQKDFEMTEKFSESQVAQIVQTDFSEDFSFLPNLKLKFNSDIPVLNETTKTESSVSLPLSKSDLVQIDFPCLAAVQSIQTEFCEVYSSANLSLSSKVSVGVGQAESALACVGTQTSLPCDIEVVAQVDSSDMPVLDVMTQTELDGSLYHQQGVDVIHQPGAEMNDGLFRLQGVDEFHQPGVEVKHGLSHRPGVNNGHRLGVELRFSKGRHFENHLNEINGVQPAPIRPTRFSYRLCYQCRKTGHYARSCPERSLTVGKSSRGGLSFSSRVTCWSCGGFGHIQRFCGRRSVRPVESNPVAPPINMTTPSDACKPSFSNGASVLNSSGRELTSVCARLRCHLPRSDHRLGVSRSNRPVCWLCGVVGHLQNNCRLRTEQDFRVKEYPDSSVPAVASPKAIVTRICSVRSNWGHRVDVVT